MRLDGSNMVEIRLEDLGFSKENERYLMKVDEWVDGL